MFVCLWQSHLTFFLDCAATLAAFNYQRLKFRQFHRWHQHTSNSQTKATWITVFSQQKPNSWAPQLITGHLQEEVVLTCHLWPYTHNEHMSNKEPVVWSQRRTEPPQVLKEMEHNIWLLHQKNKLRPTQVIPSHLQPIQISPNSYVNSQVHLRIIMTRREAFRTSATKMATFRVLLLMEKILQYIPAGTRFLPSRAGGTELIMVHVSSFPGVEVSYLARWQPCSRSFDQKLPVQMVANQI